MNKKKKMRIDEKKHLPEQKKEGNTIQGAPITLQ